MDHNANINTESTWVFLAIRFPDFEQLARTVPGVIAVNRGLGAYSKQVQIKHDPTIIGVDGVRKQLSAKQQKSFIKSNEIK